MKTHYGDIHLPASYGYYVYPYEVVKVADEVFSTNAQKLHTPPPPGVD